MNKIVLKKNCINVYSNNPLEEYLMKLGIQEENLSHFLNRPGDEDRDDPEKLTNMDRAIETMKKYNNNKPFKVFVMVDSDTDGYTSSAVLISYLRRRFPHAILEHKMHPGKEHGIVLDVIPEDTDLVIIPDAGTNDLVQQRALVDGGKDLIILDHHMANQSNYEDVIIVNNQTSPNFYNKTLSGVGIVYMFIRELDKLLFNHLEPIADEYLDLTAIGIIADVMDSRTLGTNYIMYQGLSHIKNGFLKELINRQARKITNPDWITKLEVAFYIAPVINGVIRSGSMEDKETVFTALSDKTKENETVETEYRGKQRIETYYEYAARIASNAKSRQDSNKKKSLGLIKNYIEEHELNKDNLIIVDLPENLAESINQNITGLVAMDVLKLYNRPTLILRKTTFEGKELYGGSGRNKDYFGFNDLLGFLNDSGLVEYAAGHANAQGVFIKEENIQKLRDYANEHIDPKTFTSNITEVDYWFRNNNSILKDLLFSFADQSHLWGNFIPEPWFMFTLKVGEGSVMYMGAEKTSIRFDVNGVKFVVFNDPILKGKIERIFNRNEEATINLLGRASINEWRGNKDVQVLADDVEVIDVPEEISFNLGSLI